MTPLLSATLAYAIGVLAGVRWATPGWALAMVAALAVISLGVRGRRTVLVAFCAGGAVVGGLRGAAISQDCRTLLADGAPVVVAGVPAALTTEGVALPFQAWTLSANGVPCGAAVVRVRAAARFQAALDSAARGQTPALEARGRWLAYPRRGGWPRSPVFAGAVVVETLAVQEHAATAGAVTRFRVAQQSRLRTLLPERWMVAEALLLAQKSGLTQEMRSRWVAAGLVHLLAISGMHVGLIASGVLLAASLGGLPSRTGRRLALLLTAAYVVFLGAPNAALRALLQASLLLTSLELQRPAEPFTLLAAAALGILILEPMALLDPGFQLSFAGIIGMVAWRRPLAQRLPRGLPRYVRDGIAAGMAASALTTPIAALHFGQAAWIGVFGSLLAVPLLAAAVGGLLLALLLAAVSGSAAGPHALLADVPLRLLDAVARLCAAVPGGHGYLAGTTVLALLAAVAAVILARRLLGPVPGDSAPASYASDAAHERYAARRRLQPLRWGVAVAAALAVASWAPRLVALNDRTLSIHAIDVGQGDAFAIRTPRGRWVLVDAGPRTPRSDAGRDRVVPFLLRHGARRIETLILTHPDADHIGGAAAVLEAFPVATVMDPGLPAGKDMFIDLLSAARREGQRWIAGRAGIAFSIDGVDFTVLYPVDELDGGSDANDFSLVFRLEYGSFAALFLGDAPASVEDELVARHGGRLRAAVLKVGHHGSTTSTGEPLLIAARPDVALVSAGRRNRYGHPAPLVLRRLERHNVRVLRTDELGNVTVRATRTGISEVRAR
jgi:competence protein ComEC